MKNMGELYQRDYYPYFELEEHYNDEFIFKLLFSKIIYSLQLLLVHGIKYFRLNNYIKSFKCSLFSYFFNSTMVEQEQKLDKQTIPEQLDFDKSQLNKLE